jgi:tetratricopeptide (TPR) repeat protein
VQNENISSNISDKIVGFLQKNRKNILICAGIVVFLFVGLAVFISLQDVFHKKALAGIDELTSRFDEVRFLMADEAYAADLDKLLTDVDVFVKNKNGYPASKAWSIAAQIHSSRKDWQKSKDAWLKAAKTGNKTYLGPISLFNAAAAAEEQGDIEQAIELLGNCIAHPFEFPAAPRAQFTIGRLYEKQNNYPAAIEAYRAVLTDWKDIPVWQYLARSRIAAISVR